MIETRRSRRWWRIGLRVAGRIVLGVAAAWLVLLIAYRWIDPPLTPLMLLRLPEEGRIRHHPVALEAIAPALVAAVVAAEDSRFCAHNGIDWAAVDQAVDDYDRGQRLRGASTITMQTARNLFLWPGGGFGRKAIEAGLALALDFSWPKRRVIEVYLGIAEWGPGLYGAEAAAQEYFRKPARALGKREAARLAAILPSPRQWSAVKPGPYVQKRAGTIAARAGALGALLDCVRPRR